MAWPSASRVAISLACSLDLRRRSRSTNTVRWSVDRKAHDRPAGEIGLGDEPHSDNIEPITMMSVQDTWLEAMSSGRLSDICAAYTLIRKPSALTTAACHRRGKTVSDHQPVFMAINWQQDDGHGVTRADQEPAPSRCASARSCPEIVSR